MRQLLLVSLLMFALPGAHATMSAADRGKAEHTLDVSVPFEQQKQKILTDMSDGETYAEMSQRDRQDVRDALTRIGDLLQAAGGVDQLSEDRKAKVFNDQEIINTILTRAGEDSRQVCKRERRVGSHRTTSQCYTVAERRRMREESSDELGKNFRQPILEQR